MKVTVATFAKMKQEKQKSPVLPVMMPQQPKSSIHQM